GAFDNEWHTLAFRFAGNNSLQVTPVIDGQDGTTVHADAVTGQCICGG
ncbi:hypothetical protein GL244_005256, partial [Escherichia coli]|nr:hypothetical protein [Escherichia coli]